MDSTRALLFDRLQEDLRSLRPALQDVVLCPLCLKPFSRKDLDGPNARLTVEHIVPGGVGGRWKTLTCRQCNNTQGSSIDAHLVRRIRASNALAGNGTLKATLEYEGRQLGMSFAFQPGEDGRVNHVMQVKGGPPKLLDDFQRGLSTGQIKKISFKLSLDYSEERSRLAMIRVAYLLQFETYGYRYILADGPSVIRKLISGEMPSEGQEIWRVADQLASWNCDRQDVEDGASSVPLAASERVLGHMVVFRISDGEPRYFNVLMPAQDEAANNVIPQLHKLSSLINGQSFDVPMKLP